jgi:hypothetical protein
VPSASRQITAQGWKGIAFNTMFVGTFNALPRSWVRPLGWHLMAFCKKR